MSKIVQIEFCGQVSSISDVDEDFYLTIRVNDFTSVKGNFRHDSDSPDDYYGYRTIDWEILGESGWGELCGIEQAQADDIAEKYCDTIEEKLFEVLEADER